MLGIGQNLVEPRLTNDQTLDAENIHRLFGSKIIWLVPAQDLLVRLCLYICLG